MALPTRENSGIKILINKHGRMELSVGGILVPTFKVETTSEPGLRGSTIAHIPTHLITFENQDDDAHRPIP